MPVSAEGPRVFPSVACAYFFHLPCCPPPPQAIPRRSAGPGGAHMLRAVPCEAEVLCTALWSCREVFDTFFTFTSSACRKKASMPSPNSERRTLAATTSSNNEASSSSRGGKPTLQLTGSFRELRDLRETPLTPTRPRINSCPLDGSLPSPNSAPTTRQILSPSGSSSFSKTPPSAPRRPTRFGLNTPLPTGHARLRWASVRSQPRPAEGEHWFTVDRILQYQNFCADFGPMNLACVTRFNRLVREKLSSPKFSEGCQTIVAYTGNSPQQRSNLAFMLGAYLCIEEGVSPDDAWAMFASLEPGTFASFRDATFVKSTYDLSIFDCLKVRAHPQIPSTFSPPSRPMTSPSSTASSSERIPSPL